jgi:hypothetical protein
MHIKKAPRREVGALQNQEKNYFGNQWVRHGSKANVQNNFKKFVDGARFLRSLPSSASGVAIGMSYGDAACRKTNGSHY